jgi:predicted Zn-ribbon and HTH transcriptional regulator
MSYSFLQALWERQEEITTAIEQRDSERLYQLASLEHEEGNDEVATDLKKIARNIDEEDWAHDRSIGN